MIDFHCHLDLYSKPLDVLDQVERRCEFVLAVTTSPKAWLKTKEYFSSANRVSVALGIHPEIVKNKMDELDLMVSNIESASYIGEIGIDGSFQHKDSLTMQKNVFNKILIECERVGGRILSIHSRNASNDVLQLIEKSSGKSTHILHWFSGTTKELEWAVELGCWFSVNQVMLLGKKGLSLVEKIPMTHLLPETDGPFTVKNNGPYTPWEAMNIVDPLANLYGVTSKSIQLQLRENANAIRHLAQ